MAVTVTVRRSAAAAAAVVWMMLGWIEMSKAAVYKVGDSAGWTTIGNVDYKQWAATKTFLLGDIIVFEYNPQFHNVMQVIHSEYKACNASYPISTHTTGNDSIAITTHGHHFFVCGVPGHCQAGQKVDINVLRSTQSGAPSSSVPSAAADVPAPSPSAAATTSLYFRRPLFVLQISLMLLLTFHSQM